MINDQVWFTPLLNLRFDFVGIELVEPKLEELFETASHGTQLVETTLQARHLINSDSNKALNKRREVTFNLSLEV